MRTASRDELGHYVELLDIARYLSATTSNDDVDASKPEPDIFGAALEKIGVAPSRAIVVGDTPTTSKRRAALASPRSA